MIEEKIKETLKQIKPKRLEFGLTQSELADKVGCTYTSICNYETGYKSPSLNMLKKICNVLEIEL